MCTKTHKTGVFTRNTKVHPLNNTFQTHQSPKPLKGGGDMKKIIITNNSKVYSALQHQFSVYYMDIGYIDILYETRDKVHLGYKLLTHPMAGSLKPNQTSYKSIMLQWAEGTVDFSSVTLIENCILAAVKFLNQKSTPKWNEKILDDFKTIDLSLMENAAKNPILTLYD